jgi:hypothetical protein
VLAVWLPDDALAALCAMPLCKSPLHEKEPPGLYTACSVVAAELPLESSKSHTLRPLAAGVWTVVVVVVCVCVFVCVYIYIYICVCVCMFVCALESSKSNV